MSASLINKDCFVRVSSVLNRAIKEYGKNNLFDGKEDTCWNSNQGTSQWIAVNFPEKVIVEELHIQFQGGFAGKDCWIEGGESEKELTKLEEFYPEDINSLQIFKIKHSDPMKTLRIFFNNSTDFYGRITVYKLDVIGRKISESS